MSDVSRRAFLDQLVAAAVVGPCLGRAIAAEGAPAVDDPYADVDWAAVEHIHSMSHQHQGQNTRSLDSFYAMGYRHLAFSNYYPSAPTPVPEAWLAAHPEALDCPNGEHHSFTDAGIHCCAVGSTTRTGAGWMSVRPPNKSPLEHVFKGTTVYRADERPWAGVYRLDVRLAAVGQGPPAGQVTIEGGLQSKAGGELVGDGKMVALPWDGRRGSVMFRATATEVKVTLTFDPATTRVTQFRLMQGANRPWREAFRALLDGELVDGRTVGGLEFADGGGLTINHPSSSQVEPYLTMLDADPRVLGIEVFNHLAGGFGVADGPIVGPPNEQQHYYQLWDQILGTGRRCLGFFVKDHQTCAAGRNVLLLPPAAGRSRQERRRDALRAYRRGACYGSIGAITTDANGALVPPFDHSNFRFTRHQLVRDAAGVPERLLVAVAGHDAQRRPQVQIRLIADGRVVQVTDGPTASYPIPRAGARPTIGYVRAEAFAYPARLRGETLEPARFAKLSVAQIWGLHELSVADDCFYRGGATAGNSPVSVVDLLFGQPVRFGGR